MLVSRMTYRLPTAIPFWDVQVTNGLEAQAYIMDHCFNQLIMVGSLAAFVPQAYVIPES